MTRRIGPWVLLGLACSLSGCVEPPGAEHIVGPDGTRLLHVHCGDEQVACFQIAGERCPHGYDLSPIFDPHDGNFLVRCREPRASSAVAVNPIRSTGSNGSSNPNDRWPPAEVATPTEPWPTPSNAELPPTPHSANGSVDIGY